MVLHMCIYDLIDIMLAVERDQVPRFGVLAREYTPPSLVSLGSTPFWHVADWCASDWLKNTASWRLFMLVFAVARRK